MCQGLKDHTVGRCKMVAMLGILAARHCLDARLGFSDCCFSPAGCSCSSHHQPQSRISGRPPRALDGVGGGGKGTSPSAASGPCLALESPGKQLCHVQPICDPFYVYVERAHLEHHLPAVGTHSELRSEDGLSASNDCTHWQGGGARRGRSARCTVT